jgi:uncharacterized oxidoreductase
MTVLATNATEILVEGVKLLRNNVGPDEGAFLTQFNDRLAQSPH